MRLRLLPRRVIALGASALLASAGVGTLTATLIATPAAASAGTWSELAVPDPAVQFSYVTAVDALSDTDAWAVGYVQPPNVGPFLPIIDHFNGTTWSSVDAPQLGDGTILNGVSVSQANDAWAVGYFFTHPASNGYHIQTNPAVLHWNGSTWAQTAMPDAAVVAGVSSVSPTNAWAVDSGGGVKHWDGTAWSDVATPSPNPSGVGPGSLTAISARTASDVWAVGLFAPRRHVTASFATHFDGTAWQLTPVPADTYLSSVVTVGPGDAWAVGMVQSTDQPVTLHWNGTAWSTVASVTIPAGGSLRNVSARTGSDVWAVGTAFTGDATTVAALTIHWNGTSWTSAPVSTAVVSPDLYAVSARPTSTHTWATGTQQPGFPLILERH